MMTQTEEGDIAAIQGEDSPQINTMKEVTSEFRRQGIEENLFKIKLTILKIFNHLFQG